MPNPILGKVEKLQVMCDCGKPLQVHKAHMEKQEGPDIRRVWHCLSCGELYVERPNLASLGVAKPINMGHEGTWEFVP